MALELHAGPTAKLAELTPLRLLFWLALAAWFFQNLLSNPYSIGMAHDWTYFTHHEQSAHLTYVKYRELPVWDPWFCGGIPGLGNTQNNALSLTALLGVVFGVMPGARLASLLFFVAGLEGTYRCARHHGTRGVGALAAGTLFALSGRFVQPFVDGQPVFMAFALTPWVVLGFEKGLHSLSSSFGLGAVLALIFFEGGAVTTPLMVILVGVLTLFHAGRALVLADAGLRPSQPFQTLAVAGSVALVLSLPRLLPVVENLLLHPRLSVVAESYAPTRVWEMLMETPRRVHHSGAGSSHVGLFAPAALCFALARYDRRALGYLVLLIPLFDLTLGYHKGLGFYELVKQLPILENIRNPFRFTYFLAFYLALGAGRGIALAESDLARFAECVAKLEWLGRWRSARKVAGLGVLGAGALMLVAGASYAISKPVAYNRSRLEGMALRVPPLVRDSDFRQSLGNRWHAHVWSALNLGSIACFEEQPFFTSAALRGDLPAEEYLADPAAGTLRRVSWTPHEITLDVELEREATIVVNQNSHRAWRVEPGAITPHEGLLAARAPAGKYRLVFRHRDWMVTVGFLLQGLSIFALAFSRLLPRVRERSTRAAAPGKHETPVPP